MIEQKIMCDTLHAFKGQGHLPLLCVQVVRQTTRSPFTRISADIDIAPPDEAGSGQYR